MENQQTNTALLVMDMQMGILGNFPDEKMEVIQKAAEAIACARQKNMPVLFVRLGFQKGFPEIGPSNKLFWEMKNSVDDSILPQFMKLHPGLGVQEGDMIINKKRVNAFSGNELEMILQAKNIRHLVLSGVATSGIVLSTFCVAFDKDYQLTVLSDACADRNEDVHQMLMNNVFAGRANVNTVEEWKGRLL
ncbi:MAG: isochorismatase [Chryseobacterium sp.]|nr:MAG: isochorismatase [Chryseobacterium sp.]